MASEISHPPSEHRSMGPRSVRCAVLTISDTRTLETDRSGGLICELLREAGHQVVQRLIVPDDEERIRSQVQEWLNDPDVDVVLCTGGTGFSPRDRTYEAVVPLLERHVDGFGELFRVLSYSEIGPAAMLSRALAGTVGGRAVFVMPGSSGAVRLAMEKLILPELGHLLGQLRRTERAGN